MSEGIKKSIDDITSEIFEEGELLLMSPELSDMARYKILNLTSLSKSGIETIIELAEELEKYR